MPEITAELSTKKLLNKYSYEDIEKNEAFNILFKYPNIAKANLSIKSRDFVETMLFWERHIGKIPVIHGVDKITYLGLLQKIYMDYSLKYAQNKDEYGKNFEYFGFLNINDIFKYIKSFNPVSLISFWFTYSYFKIMDLLNRNEQDLKTAKEGKEFKKIHTSFISSLKEILIAEYDGDEQEFSTQLLDKDVFLSFMNHIISKMCYENRYLDKVGLELAYTNTVRKIIFWKKFEELKNQNIIDMPGIKILNVCASVTAGVLLKKDRYPWPLEVADQLKQMIKEQYNEEDSDFIINNIPIFMENWSKTGAGFEYGLKFFSDEFPYNIKDKAKFDTVIIGLAANDFVDGKETDYWEFYKGYKNIINKCREKIVDCPIIISFPIPPTSKFPNRDIIVKKLRDIGKELEKEFKNVQYIEIPTEKLAKLNYPDSLHPDTHDPIIEQISPILFDILKPTIDKILEKKTEVKCNKYIFNLLELHKNKGFQEVRKNTQQHEQYEFQANNPRF